MEQINNSNQIHPILIGISDSGGRLELVKQLALNLKKYPSIIISLSDYLKENGHNNKFSPTCYDFELLMNSLEKLRNSESCEVYVYDINSKKSEKKTIEPNSCSAIIIEGLFCFYDESLRNLFDLKIFIDADSDMRLSQSILIGIEQGKELKEILNNFQKLLKSSYEKYVEPTKKYVDLILPNPSGHERAIEIITFHINKQIKMLKKENKSTVFTFTNQIIEPKYRYSQNKILVPGEKPTIEFIKSLFEDFILNRLDEEFIEAMREKIVEIIMNLVLKHFQDVLHYSSEFPKFDLCISDEDDITKYDFSENKRILYFKPFILNENDLKNIRYILKKNRDCNLLLCSVFLSPKYAHFITSNIIYDILFVTIYYSEFFIKYEHIIKGNKTIFDPEELSKLIKIQYKNNFEIK